MKDSRSNCSNSGQKKKQASFRIGRVRGDLRGKVWYLTYFEGGQRQRPRVGSDIQAARTLAAQINGQLASGVPAALSFDAISIVELRDRWLEHHEHVLRSSVQTIARYRTATEHLLRFLTDVQPVRSAAEFKVVQAEAFVRYLRSIEVAPNGHANSHKRRLLDSGIKYVLETCRALFNYAGKRRHLPPYTENPFAILEVERIPVEDAKPIELFTPQQEQRFFEACDDWQFPLFLTLALTGLRPGELVHLLLPDDLDLDAAVLRVCNKTRLGWQVKTRNEREIPLVPILARVLRRYVADRQSGPVFLKKQFLDAGSRRIYWSPARLEREIAGRVQTREAEAGKSLDRQARQTIARSVWQEAGGLKEDRIRREFMRLTRKIGLGHLTAPKLFRHQFATCLQEARVDPLIRNQLMGHAPESVRSGSGLGMTARYTHTRAETRREQLHAALERRAAVAIAAERLL